MPWMSLDTVFAISLLTVGISFPINSGVETCSTPSIGIGVKTFPESGEAADAASEVAGWDSVVGSAFFSALNVLSVHSTPVKLFNLNSAFCHRLH